MACGETGALCPVRGNVNGAVLARAWRLLKMQTENCHRFHQLPGGSDSKESAHSAGDQGSIPGSGRSHGEGKGYPLQYSGLENSMDCIVHGVAKSQTE